MATTRGKDGGKPAAAAQGVAPVPPEGQETTAQETALAGEKLPELTREAYEAIVIANSDLSTKLADALDAVNELNGTVAKLTAQLDASLTREADTKNREQHALAVVKRLTETGDDLAVRIEVQEALLNHIRGTEPVAAPALADEAGRLRVAGAFGLSPKDVLSWRIGTDELVVVTTAGQKIRKAL